MSRENGSGRPFREQLRAAIDDEVGLKLSELARRMAAQPGGKDREVERRWLQRALAADDWSRPTRAKIMRLEAALSRPGYFKTPACRPRRSDRLQALEEQLQAARQRLESLEARQEEAATMGVENAENLQDLGARLSTVESKVEQLGP